MYIFILWSLILDFIYIDELLLKEKKEKKNKMWDIIEKLE